MIYPLFVFVASLREAPSCIHGIPAPASAVLYIFYSTSLRNSSDPKRLIIVVLPTLHISIIMEYNIKPPVCANSRRNHTIGSY